MELRSLRYVIAVAEELHFGRAARRLFVSQPSMSQQIRKIERELGVELFYREHNKISLTPAGQALLDPARRVLAAADELPGLARGATGGAGQLAVGYVPYARTTVLTDLLDAVRSARPRADVTVRSGGDSPEVFTDLRDGRIDAGLLRAPISAPWLRSLTVTVEPFYAALPATHMLATRPQICLAELKDQPFALFPRTLNPPAHDHLMGFFAAAGYTPVIGQASRRMDESLMFVASGGGVGLFPVSTTRTVVEPNIVFRPIIDPTPTVEIILAWDANSLNPLVPTLVEVARHANGQA